MTRETATATASEPSDGATITGPCLIRLLTASRPTAGSLRVELIGLTEVIVERGAPRAVHCKGRGATVAVVDGQMSIGHARLVKNPSGWWLEDMGSKNGTYHNGIELGKPALLDDGSIIQTGATFWLFCRQPVLGRHIDSDELAALPPVLQTMSATLTTAFAELSTMAASPTSVIIRGDSGTGKELVARTIHDRSGRTGPFIAVNCGAIPENLMESELFGHVKGAFSGASEARQGLVTAADRGTLFLDEVAELPAASQAALLRVLQEREVRPVGATRTHRVDVRIVSATHQDLGPRLEDGRFRTDLYARLAGYTFVLPALRERRCDLGIMIGNVLRQKHISPLVADFKKWLDAVEPTLLPSDPLTTAVRYYQNHGDALFRFVDDPDVPIDNSPTEREFQNVAKLRLNMLFAGSTEGAHRACVLLGIAATCRTVGVPVQAYFCWAFERLGTHRDVFGLDIAEVTPAAFKKTLAA